MNLSNADDAGLLIDFHVGECDAATALAVRQRLETDGQFRRLSDDLQAAFAAIGLLPEAQGPEDLVSVTMARIRAAEKTNALIAREESLRRQGAGGFSIRDVAGVAAAILLMAAIFVPTVRQVRQRVQQEQCAANIVQIGAGMSTYAGDNDECLPAASDRPYQWLPGEGKPVVSNSSALFKLVDSGRTPPNVFQCPAVAGEALAVKPGMTDFPSAKTISYSYQHTVGHEGVLRRDMLKPSEAGAMAVLADENPVFKGGVFHPDRVDAQVSDNHQCQGQNVLFLNMNVSWCTNANVGVGGDNIFLIGKRWDSYRGNEIPIAVNDTFLLPAYVSHSNP